MNSLLHQFQCIFSHFFLSLPSDRQLSYHYTVFGKYSILDPGSLRVVSVCVYVFNYLSNLIVVITLMDYDYLLAATPPPRASFCLYSHL